METKLKIEIVNSLMKYYLKKTRIPITVSYLTTNLCNQKCRYCNWTRACPDQLSTAEAVRLIRELKECGVKKLGFAGGESLCREDIGELLKCAHDCGLITSLSTNGRNVARYIDVIKKYVDVVQISLDGPEHIHDETRGAGSFSIVMEAVKLLKLKKIKMITNTVINKYTIRDLKFVIDMAQKNDYMALFQPVFFYGLSEQEDIIAKLRPSYHEMYGAMEYLKKEKRKKMPIGNSFSFFHYVQSTWNRQHRYKCYAGDLFCTLDPMGYILPCCFDSERQDTYNAVKLGFKQAFINSAGNPFPHNCDGCYCNAYVETNMAFHLIPDVCINGLSII